MKVLAFTFMAFVVQACSGVSNPSKTILDSAKEATLKLLLEEKLYHTRKTDSNEAKFFKDVHAYIALRGRLNNTDNIKCTQYYDEIKDSLYGEYITDTTVIRDTLYYTQPQINFKLRHYK